jgi:hypothetical protein
MVMGTGAVKSPWIGVLIAVAAMAIVSVFAVVQEWDFGSWVWAAAVCAGTGIFSSITQVRRNRQLDSAARQAQEIDNGPDAEKSSR